MPTCDVCGSSLNDWVGNLMVPYATWLGSPRAVEEIRVWCKPCTRQHDPQAKTMHAIHELSSVVEKPIHLLGYALVGLTGRGLVCWSMRAASTLYDLVGEAHPDLSSQLMRDELKAYVDD